MVRVTTTSDVVAKPHDALALQHTETGVVIAVSGELTWHTVKGLQDAVAAVGMGRRLVIDLTCVTAMDSAGTSGLIATYLRNNNPDREMALVATGFIASVLDEVGISAVIPIFESRASANEWLVRPS